ncbi:MAG TPA: hypothetical protein VFH47_08710 [Candidatus Thermoplasmatota archaeon]|nr:hypothetical protein [Candidatus Thermoplasmatota archaeon]
MTTVSVEHDLDWPSDHAVLLAVTDGATYHQSLGRLAWALQQRFRHGVLVTANRPHSLLADALGRHGVDPARMQYIDCVSSMTGVPPLPQPGVHHIESPTLLEKTILRAEQLLRRTPEPRFLLVDSLSALAVFNGVQAVAELTHNLVTRLRLLQVPAALVTVERQAPPELLERTRAVMDGVLRL